MANSCMLFSTSQSCSQSPRSSWSAPTNERLQVHCVCLKKTIALPEVNIQFQISSTIRIAQHKYLLPPPTATPASTRSFLIGGSGFQLPGPSTSSRTFWLSARYCLPHASYENIYTFLHFVLNFLTTPRASWHTITTEDWLFHVLSYIDSRRSE